MHTFNLVIQTTKLIKVIESQKTIKYDMKTYNLAEIKFATKL